MVKVNIEVTSSKMMGYLMIIMAFILDLLNDKSGTIFMFSIPFVVLLVTGKQYFDLKKKTE